MRIFLKILALPIIIILTVIVPLLLFLCHISGWVFSIASSIVGILGFIQILTGTYNNGSILLIIALLVSPFGLPALATWTAAKLYNIKYSLTSFMTN